MFCVFVALVFVGVCQATSNRPVIGILTQPTDGKLTAYGSSYIAASYVKYVESGGARAVPVFHNSTKKELQHQFNQLDGILFPGGGSDLGPHTALFKSASFFYESAIQERKNGGYFTIFGHCMGFELLNLITSEDPLLLRHVDASNISMPLVARPALHNSRMFKNTPNEIVHILENEPVTYNSHHYGVLPSEYKSGGKLDSFYEILSTNFDRAGIEFVSTIESRDFPIYGLQWHPEKAMFEWRSDLTINHKPNSIIANDHMARFFVDEARKSKHVFTDDSLLIYNFAKDVVYSGAWNSDFEQCYVFKR